MELHNIYDLVFSFFVETGVDVSDVALDVPMAMTYTILYPVSSSITHGMCRFVGVPGNKRDFSRV